MMRQPGAFFTIGAIALPRGILAIIIDNFGDIRKTPTFGWQGVCEIDEASDDLRIACSGSDRHWPGSLIGWINGMRDETQVAEAPQQAIKSLRQFGVIHPYMHP